MGVSTYELPLGAHFQGIDGSAELKSKNTIIGNDDKIVFTMDTGNTPHWFAAIKKGYKLVLHKNDVPWLFDLNQDPDELQNEHLTCQCPYRRHSWRPSPDFYH